MDIKNGIPPASDSPKNVSPEWKLLKQCWSFLPDRRPSALGAARAVRAITFTVPSTILIRVIMYATEGQYSGSQDGGDIGTDTDRDMWRKRNQLLGRLCLVSKSFQSSALPFIYENIRIYLSKGLISLSSLISTLEASTRTTTTGRRGYGSYSKSLVIHTGAHSNGVDDTTPIDMGKVSVGFLALIGLLPGITSAVFMHAAIESASPTSIPETGPISDVSRCLSLTSVHLRGLGGPLVLSWLSTLQHLPSLQRLELQFLPRSKETPPIPEGTLYKVFSFPKLHDLRIQETGMSEGVGTGMRAMDYLLTATALWVMPRLASLRITSLKFDAVMLSAFEAFIQAHGRRLDSLALDTRNTPEALLATVLLHCNNLRSIVFPVSDFSDFYNPGFSRSHEKLERAELVCSGGYNSALLIPSQKMLKRFRLRTQKRYVKLREVKLEVWNWYSGDIRTLKWSASLRTDNKAVDIWRARLIYRHSGSMSSLSLRSGNSSPPTSVSGAC
jgi:hypothetical protein